MRYHATGVYITYRTFIYICILTCMSGLSRLLDIVLGIVDQYTVWLCCNDLITWLVRILRALL